MRVEQPVSTDVPLDAVDEKHGVHPRFLWKPPHRLDTGDNGMRLIDVRYSMQGVEMPAEELGDKADLEACSNRNRAGPELFARHSAETKAAVRVECEPTALPGADTH